MPPGKHRRWGQTREACTRAVAKLQREQEIGQKLGDGSPSVSMSGLHPWVWDAARTFWAQGAYRVAVREAASSLNAHTQAKVGRYDVADHALLGEVFSASARQERARLRRDLHDGLGPSLAGVALGLKAVEVMLQADPERTGQLLLRLRQEVQSATGEVRRILDDLRPESLDALGLVAALRERANALCQQAGGALVVRVDAPAELAPLPPEIETAAYKIGVEALTNVARHSGARTCIVQLRRGAGAVNVEISDDGRGLHEQRIAGLGLSTMGQRAEMLGGVLEVAEATGGGTRVVATLPAGQP